MTGAQFARAVVSTAAALTAGWSLYAVARHYDAPKGIAGAAVLVFDGIAYMCLHLASEAAADGRSSFGARVTVLGMAGVSVYLNHTHADLIRGGLPAFALFAVPTLGLLAVSELAWAGPRARARRAHGEQPFRFPTFGGWAWALAPRKAGTTVRSRAIEHIERDPRATEATRDPDRSPQAVLRRRFADMDPADAVQLAHDALPDATPAELASDLTAYGVTIDAVQVAMILGHRPAEYAVHRPASPPHQQVNPPVPALDPVNLQGAVEEAAAALGPDASPKAITEHVERHRRLIVDEAYVRTALSRAAAKRQPPAGGDQMRGGYA
ncbi:hypothetical protein [Streptomyces sp. NPDC088785]|uniref:hypothetical protein n=1 Tax=Streptomyces sp. NPDC088785 TaxID=3365897 RepID=UPI00381909F8